MNNKMITTIIFDVGGTLVTGPDIFTEISREIKKAHGINIEQELKNEFKRVYTSPTFYDVKTILNNITKNILTRKGISQTQIVPSKIYYDVFVNRSELFKESKEILEYLKNKKIKLIIVCDADSDVLIPELKNLDIINYFEHVIISSDIKCYKTSKKIVNHISHLLSGQKESILFVGDSFADIYTAKNLNIQSVFINRITNEKKGDINITSLLELKKFI